MSQSRRNPRATLGLALCLSMGSAYAGVDVNTANESALESVSGIGAAKARAIIKEREANGPYKDSDDLAARISGIGPKSIAHLRENGLTIGASGSPQGGAGGTSAGNSVSSGAVGSGTGPTSTDHVASQVAGGRAPGRATQGARK